MKQMDSEINEAIQEEPVEAVEKQVKRFAVK